MSLLRRRIFLPRIADLLFIAFFVILALKGGQRLLLDGDTGHHVRAGEFMLDQRALITQDPFSFITPPIRYKPWDWLAEITIALLHRAGGMNGVVIFFAFLIALLHRTVYAWLQEESNILTATLIMPLVLFTTLVHWLARPHIFSMLLFLFFMKTLEDYLHRGRNRLLWLVPAMALWVNLHGAYITGLFLIGLHVLGCTGERLIFKNPGETASPQRIHKLLVCLAGCLAASLINPQGWNAWIIPFKVVGDDFFAHYIAEFKSPDFHKLYVFQFLIYLPLLIFAKSRTRPQLAEPLILIFFFNMALFSARHAPLFALAAAPIAARHFGRVQASWKGRLAEFLNRRLRNFQEFDLSLKNWLWPAGAAALAVFLIAAGVPGYAYNPGRMPVEAVRFLKSEPVPAHLFSSDEYGDYLIYAAWPQYKVAADGRIFIYGRQVPADYQRIWEMKPDWPEIIRKYNFNSLLIPTGSALTAYFLEREDWRLIYSDPTASIFVRNQPEYQALIEKYAGVRPAFKTA